MAGNSSSSSGSGSSWLTLHSGVAAPEHFLKAQATARGVVTVTGLFFVWAFYAMLVRFHELRRKEARLRRKAATRVQFQKRVVMWMLANAGFNVAQQATNSINLGVGVVSQSVTYCQVVARLNTFAYFATMWSNYQVLIIRARTTSLSAGKWHKLLQWGTEKVVTIGMPCFVLLGMYLFRGRVLFDSSCTLEPSALVTVIFICSDFGLSMMLLTLFVLPVFQHANSVEETVQGSNDCSTARGGGGVVSGSSAKREVRLLRSMARKNLWLSAAQVVSTAAVQTVALLVSSVWNDELDPDRSYLRYYLFCGYGIDLWLNTLTLMMMSNAWVPKSWPWLYRKLSPLLDDDKNAAHAASAATSQASSAVADEASSAPKSLHEHVRAGN